METSLYLVSNVIRIYAIRETLNKSTVEKANR